MTEQTPETNDKDVAEKGRQAPNFSAEAYDPKQDKNIHINLSDFKAGPILIVFYPGDFTPVCTTQMCDYSENLADFAQFDLHIFGISKDTLDSHRKFALENNINFPLIADPEREIASKYGAQGLGITGATKRGVFLLDKDQTIVYKKVENLALFRRKADELRHEIEKLV